MFLPDAVWTFFEQQLFRVASNPITGLFNLYNSIQPVMDGPNADKIRRKNLRHYVDCFRISPKLLLVGEAPGWRGYRFSGVPFTSEAQLAAGTHPFSGHQSSNAAKPLGENSANYIWAVLAKLHPDVFLWNAIPMHPHQPGMFAENRKPTIKERKQFELLTEGLISILKPHSVIAVGRVAESALQRHNPKYVRHPSFGGASEFRNEIRALGGIR